MGNFGNKLRQWMAGRYGFDNLNRFLLVFSLILLVVEWIWPFAALKIGVLILLVWIYFRTFSRNIAVRYAENQKYLKLTAGVRTLISKNKRRWQQRKTHRFYKCPKCKQTIRVPKGKGKISISCPKCSHKFIKKT